MSGWVFHKGTPRPDPVPQRYLDRVAERRAVPDVRVAMAIGWAIVGDVFYIHDEAGETIGRHIEYHVSRAGIVTVHGRPCDIPAPAGLVWRSAPSDELLPGVPVIRET